MFKRILIYTGYTLLTGVLAAYFVLSSRLSYQESRDLTCKEIKVIILDSSQNRFVTPHEIKELLRVEGVTINESKLRNINQYELENVINNRTAVRLSHVSYTRGGVLRVTIRQRRPILRIETPNGGFYMDESSYIFPLMRSFTSYVPVITGSIPLGIPPGFRGVPEQNKEWVKMIHAMALYLERETFWNSLIGQIFVDSKGDLYLYPRVGRFEIVFGKPDDIEFKFRKLNAFYTKVIPAEGWDKYSKVDVRFSTQLVCKKRDNKQIKT
ncbi:MAG: hypothetical protein Q8R90_00475 [Bacteroidales bacterium]|jgi:cell division protein FtsQ|nr:hypothetical protein [Bacteroidales bacterium]